MKLVKYNMDVDDQLIEEVRSHPILYDVGHPNYKSLNKKKLAWRKVAAEVQMSEIECKKRWKGLRDSYKRCIRAEQSASESTAKGPTKRWRYFEAMSFLDNVATSRLSFQNSNCDELVGHIKDMIDNDSSEDIVSPPSICSSTILEKKKSDSEKFQKFLNLAAASFSESCVAAGKKTKEEDSTAIFLAGLAAKIKAANMPPSVVNKIEAKVSALVFAEIDKFFSKQH